MSKNRSNRAMGRTTGLPVNALKCTERAMELAVSNGIGCVALSNTNHWMRGGTYGWKAAKAGFLFIGWTNTLANMPAWGGVENTLGNNPLVLAIPYGEEAIVLDMAMSQYSYGALETAKLKGQSLKVPGGFDRQGLLSTSPSEILDSGRILPAGFWKGAGLSLLLDIMATVLSGGASTAEISKREAEYGISQVFIAMDLKAIAKTAIHQELITNIIHAYKSSSGDEPAVLFPGERVANTRKRNLKDGIPVNKKIWEEILKF